jgi:hypothetical protein
MTKHRNVTAQSGHTTWWLTANFIPGLLVGVLLLMGYVALLGADSVRPAQGAPKPAVAGGPAIGYAMDAAAETRLAEVDLIQPYINWLQAAHAHTAVAGLDAPPPSQYVMYAAAEKGLAEVDLIQPYTDWPQAAHGHAAVHGQDAPLPNQF